MGDHCRGVTKRYPIVDALGRAQEARVLSEPDVLRLIVNCTLPAAQAFERLVFEEILPSIHKTGSYSAPVALSDAERFLQSAQLFVAMEHCAAKLEQAQVALSTRLDANTAALKGFRQACPLIRTKENQFLEFLAGKGLCASSAANGYRTAHP